MRRLALIWVALCLTLVAVPVVAQQVNFADSDGDNFFDPIPDGQVDACPNEPGVAPDGCPEPPPEYGHHFTSNACEDSEAIDVTTLGQIANGPANTTFCLQDGTYTVGAGSGLVPPENARIIGEYSDGSAPVIDAGVALNGIRAQSRDSLYLEDLEILGAEYIEEGCSPEANCGRGVYPAENTTFVNLYLHHNENNGIGGGGGQTLLVENSTLSENGNQDSARDDPANDPVSAAGIKATQGTVLTVRDSLVKDNFHDGLWLDVQGGGMNVYDSLITGNYRGIHYEISYGPGEISGNVIQGNGLSSPMNPNSPAGILLQNSQDVDIHDNDFGGNEDNAAQFGNSSSRTPQMARVSFHDNRLNGDTLKNCSISGVTCTNNQ